MPDRYRVFYVAAFPIAKISDRGESGWHSMPGHTRNRYRFEEAILEHIDNTFCEPVQIVMRSEGEVQAGPSGVVRLHALATLRGATHIPAIVSAREPHIPQWLDISKPIQTREELRGYYRLEPSAYGFEPDGRAYHHNHNPNAAQVLTTFVVSDATRARILAMLAEEESR